MATLTEVSYYTRKAIKWGAVGFVVILLAPVVLGGVKKLYLILRPPPPTPPTVRYGRLPKLQFPKNNEADKPQLRLETVDGQVPKLANVSRVYFVEVNKSRLLELDRIKARARVLGLVNEAEKINEQTYKFGHPSLPATLTVDVIYNVYNYKYDWTLDQSLYTGQQIPNNEQAFGEAKNFWQGLGLLATDLAEGKAKYSYFAAQPPEMVPVSSLSEANFVRVDIFRADKDGMAIVAASGDKSSVDVTFSGSTDRTKRVVEANYIYSKIVENDFATYPLKTAEQAWNELQQGGGYVAKKAGAGQAVVRKIALAYFESDTPQEFLQPVFVFEGDGGFTAYVAALSPEYVQ